MLYEANNVLGKQRDSLGQAWTLWYVCEILGRQIKTKKGHYDIATAFMLDFFYFCKNSYVVQKL